MSVEQTDAESAAIAKNPDGRVKLADIEAAIAFEFTCTGLDLTDVAPIRAIKDILESSPSNLKLLNNIRCLTVHLVVMKNGFSIVGKSAPLDPNNYDAAFGRKLAREDAIRQLWPLMAFARASSPQ